LSSKHEARLFDGDRIQSKGGRGSLLMSVVCVNLSESMLQGGDQVKAVSRAKKNVFRQRGVNLYGLLNDDAVQWNP
jgi:hypothetical protein